VAKVLSVEGPVDHGAAPAEPWVVQAFDVQPNARLPVNRVRHGTEGVAFELESDVALCTDVAPMIAPRVRDEVRKGDGRSR